MNLLFLGGSIGTMINSYFGPIGFTVVTLRDLIQQLNNAQLQTMFTLLNEGIIHTVVNVLGQVVNSNLQLMNLLEIFGSYALVRLNVIKIMTDFFQQIHNNRLIPIAA